MRRSPRFDTLPVIAAAWNAAGTTARAEPLPTDDGYRGIWYANQPSGDEHANKYSGGLYKYTELAADVEVLIEGGVEGNRMPQTWRRVNKERGGQRVFYTRYDPDDAAKSPKVRDMLVRALFWAAGRDADKAKRK